MYKTETIEDLSSTPDSPNKEYSIYISRYSNQSSPVRFQDIHVNTWLFFRYKPLRLCARPVDFALPFKTRRNSVTEIYAIPFL